MFGNQRAKRAQRLAEDAWDSLVAAMEAAGRSARKRTHDIVDDTSDRVGSVTEEARRRASLARDALAGRRPPTPWGLVLGALAAGAALGWAVAAAIGRASSSDLTAVTPSADTSPAPGRPGAGAAETTTDLSTGGA